MGVHRARRGEPLVAPHLVEQPFAGDHLTPVLDQEREKVELLPRHPHLLARLEHLPAAEANAHVAERKLGKFLPRPRAPQHRAHASEELAQREGLGDVVVGAQLEAEHAVDLGAARGEHDHGHVDAAAAELPADVPAAQPGHHDVEQYEVGRVAQGERERVLAVRRRGGLVALEAQVVLEAAHDLGLIVHDQDPRHGPFTGSHRVKRLPAPAWLSTVTRP